MNLYDTITQSDLNDIIDLLLEHYHKEISLSMDNPTTEYCNLTFNTSNGEDAGTEIILNRNKIVYIGFSNQKLADLEYSLRFYYYQLDKGDYTQTHDYGELQTRIVDLNNSTVNLYFPENQIYLQKNFDLILASGYHLELAASESSITYGDTVKLTATLTYKGNPVAETNVGFYEDDTLLDTIETDEYGVAELTLQNLSIATHTFKAKTAYNSSENVIVVVDQIPTSITITSDAQTITYGGSITISGALSTGESGKTITLYQDNTQIATVTTSAGGLYLKEITGLNAGTYTFKASYAGDSTHSGSTSSDLSITVNKANPTMVIDVPSGVPIDVEFHISGTLDIDYDGEVLRIYGLTSYTYPAYVQDKAFDETFTLDAPGEYPVLVSYPGSANYNGVEYRDTITVYDSIALTAQKTVLSYVDGDKTDLYAQLQYNGDDVEASGVTITFTKGNTVIGTATTNSTGKATLTNAYTSARVGDVTFYATDYNVTSATCTIEDCLDYDDLTADSGKFTLTTGSAAVSYNSDGMALVGMDTTNTFYMYNGSVPNNYVLEYDVVSFQMGADNFGAEVIASHTTISNGVVSGTDKTRFYSYNSSYSVTGYNDISQISTPFHLKIAVINGTATFYVDDVQVHQRSCGVADIGFKTYNNRGIVIKNMKIKALPSLSANKSVLSYMDSETATITAYLPAGQTIQLYDASDDSLLGTMTDNQDGTYSYTYNSQGIGDIGIYAKRGDIPSAPIVITDYYKYYNDTYSGTTDINLSLPTNYQIKFVLYSTDAGNFNICYLGFDSSSGETAGKISPTSRNITVSGIGRVLGPISSNVDVEYTFTKNNGTVSLTNGTLSVSGSTGAYNSLNHVKGSINGKVKNIRIIKL